MITLINLGLGLGLEDYSSVCSLGYDVTSVSAAGQQAHGAGSSSHLRPWPRGKQHAPLPHPITRHPPPFPWQDFCTLFYLLYMATSAILLLNLLIAMIIRT